MPAYGQLQQQAVVLEKYLLYSKVFFPQGMIRNGEQERRARKMGGKRNQSVGLLLLCDSSYGLKTEVLIIIAY